MNDTALLVIDIQNDYFPGGGYPLWNSAEVLTRTVRAIAAARSAGMPVILVQHVANPDNGPSPFFNQDTEGVQIHPAILAAAPDAPVVVKRHADSFHQTDLGKKLANAGISNLLLCGMMTQNCVTHTAISKSAENYRVTVLGNCCTTVDAMIHAFALNALSTRVIIADSTDVLVVA